MPKYLEIELSRTQYQFLEKLIESYGAAKDVAEGVLIPEPEIGHKIRWDEHSVRIKLPEVS